MIGSEKLMTETDIQINQFKIKNLVVCENHKYRSNQHYLNSISIYDRREEYKKIASDNFIPEILKLK
jgi:hypothetical protein